MRSINLFVIFVLLIAANAGVVVAESPAKAIQVKVSNKVLHQIDRRLFGQFMERASWGRETGAEAAVISGTHKLRPKAKQLLREMQIPIVLSLIHI